MMLLGAGVAFATPVLSADRPQRVVSLGLCTDQLALLMAQPGQLKSITYLSAQERLAIYPIPDGMHINHGLVEEIYALQPDLVIAGTFGARMTINILRRLSVPVVEFGLADSLKDLKAQISQMAEILEVDPKPHLAMLDGLQAEGKPRLRGLFYSANGYTPGANSLAEEVLNLSGISNLSSEFVPGTIGRMDLEQVVYADPDLVLIPKPYVGHSIAEEGLTHPALQKMGTRFEETGLAKYWSCATPAIHEAIASLRQISAAMGAVQ